jgi:hypothetical protein
MQWNIEKNVKNNKWWQRLIAPAPGHTLATIGQVPADSGWLRPRPRQPRPAAPGPSRPHPGPAWLRQGHGRPHPGSPDLATKKMELRSPGLVAHKNGAAGIRTHNPGELPLSYILFYDWCFWYISFTLYVVPRQNNIKMMRQWGFKPWPSRTWSIISPLHQDIVGAFFHLLNINTRTWILCGCLDQSGCATSLI